MNTHKGIFQQIRLQYGVHSATGIFQREIEKSLSWIPFKIIQMGDVSDEEHLQNLEKVILIL